jgi:hypothetical protein
MPTITNTAEGYTTSPTTVTAGNSGGASGDAATTVTPGTASTIQAVAGAAAHGAMGYRFTLVGNTSDGPCRITWNLSDAGRVVISAYIKTSTAVTSGAEHLLGIRSSAGPMGTLVIRSDGKLQLQDGNGTGITASVSTAALVFDGRVYRIEMAATKGATTTTGILEYAYFNTTVTDTTPVQSYTSPATVAVNTTTGVTQVVIGRGTGQSQAHTIDYDDVRGASTASGWLSPIALAPTANAGEDQFGLQAGTAVTLDGSGSIPGTGGSLTYAWLQTSGTSVALSSSTAVQPSFVAPAIAGGGNLVFQLTVDDGTSTDTDSVTIGIADSAGATNVRETRFSFAAVGTVITAANSGNSTNDAFDLVNGSPVIASGGAHNNCANVTGNSTTAALFTWGGLPLLTSFGDRYYVKIGSAPNALAQLHQLRNTAAALTIVGNNLTTGGAITLVNAANSTVHTSGSLSLNTWYRAEKWGKIGTTTSNGELHWRLYQLDSTTAIDSYDSTTENLGTVGIDLNRLGKHATTTVYTSLYVDNWTLTATNAAVGPFTDTPTAVAGPDQINIEPYAGVTLDGTQSLLGSGSTLTYAWTQTAGTTVTPTATDTATPHFTAPPTLLGDTLQFQLIVNDGTASPPDTTNVTVLPHTIWLLGSGGTPTTPIQRIRL